MSAPEIYEHQMKVTGPYSSLESQFSSRTPYLYGCVVTKHGLVEVYSWEDHTRLHFIIGATSYYRRFNKGFKERYLVTLASRFAREITEKLETEIAGSISRVIPTNWCNNCEEVTDTSLPRCESCGYDGKEPA